MGEDTTSAQRGLNKTVDVKTDKQLRAEQLTDKTVVKGLRVTALIALAVADPIVINSHISNPTSILTF